MHRYLTIINSDNGLSPDRRQSIIWTKPGILSIEPILIGILTFSFKKRRLKVSSAKWRPFCLGLIVLRGLPCNQTQDLDYCVYTLCGCVHYGDVITGTITTQITSLTVVYSTVYSDADQWKHQSSASLAFVWGIRQGPVNSPHKWPVTRKMFPFDDVIMQIVSMNDSNMLTISWLLCE